MKQALWHLPDHLWLQLPHQIQHGDFQGEDAVKISPKAFIPVLLLLGKVGNQVPLEGVIGCLLLGRGCTNLASTSEPPIALERGLPIHPEEVPLSPEKTSASAWLSYSKVRRGPKDATKVFV